MRILQVIETGGPGGAETVFVRLASSLASGGHRVETIVGSDQWLAGELRRREIPVRILQASGALDLTLLAALRQQIRAFRPDVVHAHLFGGAVYAVIAARLEGTPSVVTLHGQHDIRDVGMRLRLKRAILRRWSNGVVAVSHSLRDSSQSLLKLRDAQFTVIPNGVEPASVSDLPGSRGAGLRLVAVGNIREPKDYPTMLRAVAALRDEFPDLVLEIAGERDRIGIQEHLEQLVEELEISAHVRFRGFLADPMAFLANADCFVLSSTREGFSIATIEAMLSGTPVVATRSGGPEEIIVHGRTGLLVPPSDPAALATAIASVLRSPDFARELREQALVEARASYSLETMVARYLTLYAQVARSAQ